MKTRTKVALTVLCALLLVTVSILGTLAYLTSEKTVTNTFTVGNVTITLDEAKVDNNGQKITGEGAARVDANTYKLYPGKEYDKDPTIHVDANSEDCWIFVKVENNIADIEEDGALKIATQMETDWTLVTGTTNVYAYNQKAVANNNIVVFDGFKIAGTINNETLALYQDKKIIVTGYAIQAEGFASAQAAWDAAKSQF